MNRSDLPLICGLLAVLLSPCKLPANWFVYLSCPLTTYFYLSLFRLFGTSPFTCESKQDTFARITACDYEFDPEVSKLSPEAEDFIQRLLVKNLRKRMTAEEAMSHPWIRGDFAIKKQLDFLPESSVDDEENDDKNDSDFDSEKIVPKNGQEYSLFPKNSNGSRDWRKTWRRAIRIVLLHNRHLRRKLMPHLTHHHLHNHTHNHHHIHQNMSLPAQPLIGGHQRRASGGSQMTASGSSSSPNASRTPSPLSSYHHNSIVSRRCVSETSTNSFPHTDQDFERSIASLKVSFSTFFLD